MHEYKGGQNRVSQQSPKSAPAGSSGKGRALRREKEKGRLQSLSELRGGGGNRGCK